MIKLEQVHEDSVYVEAWYAIRNHPKVRQWSRKTRAISEAEHRRWFAVSLRNPLRRLYLVRAQVPLRPGWTVIGIARLDHRKTWTELSLAVDPLYWGRGYGKMIVRLLTKAAIELTWPAPGAVVNGKNAASLKICMAAGYVTEAKKWVQLTYSRGPR